MNTQGNIPYSNIIGAIQGNSRLSKALFQPYVETVNGQSIFELSETELYILEFIRSEGRKISLNLVLNQENPKTGQLIKKFTPNEKISTDLLSYKHTPYQYVISINPFLD